MSDPIHCPDCGAELPTGQPKGLCARCALKGALDIGAQEVSSSEFRVSSLPRSFGDYELLEEIARGGMGIVFKARQRKLDRIVAVKMILAGEFASREQALRFRVEAEAAARLQHPNIVRIHETGEQDGQPYFSMDYVEGGNLTRLVREKPLPAKRAAGYVKTIAEAIHHAHEQGILHRDLKPSNVLIDHADQPRVTDFGLAKRMTKESFLTVTGDVMGSPSFMPPEQAGYRSRQRLPRSSGAEAGEEAYSESAECEMRSAESSRSLVTSATTKVRAGRYSDVYGLGAILFYLVTGRPPFVAENVAETLHHVLNTEPVSPRLLNPSVPQDIATICLECLEKEPAKRYQTAQQLADELDRFLNDEPIHARSVSRPEKLWRWCRRKPAIASMATAIALVASIGIAGWLVAREKAGAADRAMVAKVKADEDAARETQKAAEILRSNDEFLLREVLKDTNNLRSPALLKALEEAISRQPTNHALWRAKSEVLKRENRFEDALDSLSKAIELASTDTKVPPRTRIDMLLARSKLLSQMNRQSEADIDYSEAGRINCERKNIPARDPQTNPEMLDLSPFFQSRLPSLFKMLSTDGEAANTVRENVKRNTGVEFDLRGGMNVYDEMKYLLTGIAVNRRFLRFHALHSLWGSGVQDAKIAVYVLHYADGQTREVPMRYGQHVRDVWRRDSRPPTGALVAWRGDSNGANKDSRGVQFFKTTWENPRPEAEVRSIDFSPGANNVYPIVLGITVEQATPDHPEFWTIKATEAERRGDFAESLQIHDRGIRQLPDHPVLWSSKGRLFERFGSTNEALEAYTKAIDMAADNTNAFLKVLTSALLQRSSLFLKLGRFDEAGLDNCRARNFPLRDPLTATELLDLSPFYEDDMSWFLGSKHRERLNAFLLEVRQNTGVAFDVRGFVALAGTGVGDVIKASRHSVTSVPVNRHCAKLHVLHSASNVERKGTRTGSFILHYADGQSAELPIIYGEHVRSRRDPMNSESVANAVTGWLGVSDKPEAGTKVTVFKATWTNPHPTIEVKSLDFVSAMTASFPVLLAITVE